MPPRLSLNEAARAYWQASHTIRSETAPERSAEAAILDLIDMAGFFAKSHPPVAARAASTLRDLGLMSRT